MTREEQEGREKEGVRKRWCEPGERESESEREETEERKRREREESEAASVFRLVSRSTKAAGRGQGSPFAELVLKSIVLLRILRLDGSVLLLSRHIQKPHQERLQVVTSANE